MEAAMFTREYLMNTGFPPASMERIQRDIDSLLESFQEPEVPSTFPPVNAWVGEESIQISAQIPGVIPEDLDLQITGKTLVLKGERKESIPEDADRRIHRERHFGPFQRKLELPYEVDPESAEATSNNGILTVKLNRAERDKPRRITVAA
jgi:HSP20 family protein